MRDFKKELTNKIKCAAFFAIMMMIFGALSVKTETALLSSDHLVPVRNKNIYRIRREPADSIDVIVLGDSLSYSSISPMRLFKDYGFTSYVCGQSGQKMTETEDMLKTALSVQKPRVVLLEVNALFRDVSGMSSLNDRIESFLNYHIPVFRGHDTWKSLVMDKEYAEENYKGFAFRCTVEPYEKKGNYMKDTGQTRELTDTIRAQMDRIIRLCEEADTQLVLLGTPSPANYNYAKHMALSEYAREKSLVWLDMNLLLKEVGIDWKTDSLDQGDHLNLSGAEKVTAYLGKYLSEKFELPDHRGDPVYTAWAVESDAYEKKTIRCLKKIRGGEV